jgi:SAM-dependent methyltransferase
MTHGHPTGDRRREKQDVPARVAGQRLGVGLRPVTDDEFIAAAYRLLLRREPEPTRAAAEKNNLRAGILSRAGLASALVASDEFRQLRSLDDAIAAARGGPLYDLHAEPGTTERAIEIPWVLSRIRSAGSVLGTGYANVPQPYLDALTNANFRRLVGVGLAARDVPGIETVTADLRDLPFADDSFDVIASVSTIEHVGLDNSVHGQTGSRDPFGMVVALEEFARVCKPGGSVLITVPVGVGEDHGPFVQQPAVAWLELFGEAGLIAREHEIYELGPKGWGHVTGEPPVRYGERGPGASALLCGALSA